MRLDLACMPIATKLTVSKAKAASLAPWFEPHIPRNIYLSLLHLEPAPGQKPVPDSILRAALLRRATEDIHRVLAIRSAKAALGVLVQRGSVGDDLWQRFQRAEQEIEDELRDVVTEVCAAINTFTSKNPHPNHLTRPTPSPLAGAPPFSKPPTKWPPTL